MLNAYRCPVCHGRLAQGAKVWACPKGHSFDISREGCVNLLLANQKHSKDPGDSGMMVESRSRFLASGHYEKLSDLVNRWVVDSIGRLSQPQEEVDILDIGCGEGYYDDRLVGCLGKTGLSDQAKVWGIDISRSAVRRASKRSPSVRYAIGSCHHLPYVDGGIDLAFSIFAPLDPEEVRRVLATGGRLLVVRPGPTHLKELAERIYGRFELQNKEKDLSEILGLSRVDEGRLEYKIDLKGQGEIMDLAAMTPYYWSLSPEKTEALRGLGGLKVNVDFRWQVFEKPKSR